LLIILPHLLSFSTILPLFRSTFLHPAQLPTFPLNFRHFRSTSSIPAQLSSTSTTNSNSNAVGFLLQQKTFPSSMHEKKRPVYWTLPYSCLVESFETVEMFAPIGVVEAGYGDSC